jgi:hypothetical protein
VFVCEWPAAGIELTRCEIDTEQIRAAASAAVVLWQDDDDRGGDRGGGSMQYLRAVAGEAARAELEPAARAWLAENRDTLRQRLRDAGVAACPACGADQLKLSRDPLKTDARTGGEHRRPAFEFECGRCGHLLRFDASQLGFAR